MGDPVTSTTTGCSCSGYTVPRGFMRFPLKVVGYSCAHFMAAGRRGVCVCARVCASESVALKESFTSYPLLLAGSSASPSTISFHTV